MTVDDLERWLFTRRAELVITRPRQDSFTIIATRKSHMPRIERSVEVTSKKSLQQGLEIIIDKANKQWRMEPT